MTVTPVHIVGLGGSLRAGSTTLALLRFALSAAESRGATTELVDLRALPLPLYEPDDPIRTPEVERLLAAARRGDGFIFATAVYHNTLTGAMKKAWKAASGFLPSAANSTKPISSVRPVAISGEA